MTLTQAEKPDDPYPKNLTLSRAENLVTYPSRLPKPKTSNDPYPIRGMLMLLLPMLLLLCPSRAITVRVVTLQPS